MEAEIGLATQDYTCSDTSNNCLPEEQSAVTWLPPSWEVRTKVSCDALTSAVDAFKPMLEESFQALADILLGVTKIPSQLCHREMSHS